MPIRSFSDDNDGREQRLPPTACAIYEIVLLPGAVNTSWKAKQLGREGGGAEPGRDRRRSTPILKQLWFQNGRTPQPDVKRQKCPLFRPTGLSPDGAIIPRLRAGAEKMALQMASP
jgi:hypothetical protein